MIAGGSWVRIGLVTCWVLACEAGGAAASATDKSLPALIEQLQPPHSSPERLQAAEALVAYGDNAVLRLIPLLQHSDCRTRFYTCLALHRLGPVAADAVPALLKIAGDANDDLCQDAMAALGRIGPAAADAVPVLKRRLCSDPATFRETTTTALVEIGSASVPALIECLHEADPAVVRAACTAIQKLGPQAAAAVPALASKAFESSDERVREAAFLALAGVGADAVGELTRMLNDADPVVRRLAAMALHEMQPIPPEAQAVLRDRVHDPQPDVRFWAVRALGDLPTMTPPVVETLTPALRDSDADVRWQSLMSLSRVSTEKIRGAIRDLANDPHPAVRSQAQAILDRTR